MKKINNTLKFGILSLVIGIYSCGNDDSSMDTKPVAAFSVNADEVEEGQPIVFTDLSFDQNGSIASWNWDLGDGTTSTEQSPAHIFPLGEFTVKLTVTDNSGNKNTNDFSKTVSILEPSTATREPQVIWLFSLPGKLESASPAVGDDGTVYMACSAKDGLDNMFAINPDGSEKWAYATGDINRSTVSIDDNGKIYVGSYDDNLYGFSPDGNVRFNLTRGGIRGTMVLFLHLMVRLTSVHNPMLCSRSTQMELKNGTSLPAVISMPHLPLVKMVRYI